jgi:hypothetical protein
LTAVAMLSPSAILIGIFVYGFIAWSIRVSMSDWQGLIPSYNFVGLDNFTHLLFNDRRFQIDLRNTAIFSVPSSSAAPSSSGSSSRSCSTASCRARASSAACSSSPWRSRSS